MFNGSPWQELVETSPLEWIKYYIYKWADFIWLLSVG